jgi:hypothetical protein
MKARLGRTVGSVTSLDGLELVQLEPDHAPLVLEMVARRGNRYLIELGSDADQVAQMLAELRRTPWSLSMAVLRADECIGMATTALANLRSLHANVLALFVDPPSSVLALAMFLRHVFWNFPLHRLYTHVPMLDLTAEYARLYQNVGFADEGRFVAHAVVAGQPFDVTALGLLRSDFESWCAVHEPRLTLR